MIASDIHGSAHWCEKLLEAFGREKPVKLLLLGDILYHGPRNELPEGYAPKEVFAMLNPLKERLLCVRGNCDSEVDQMVLEFPVLADYALLFSAGRTIYATHGHLAARPPRRPCARAIFCSTDTRTSPASESFRAESCTQTAVPLPCPKKIPPIPISFWKRKKCCGRISAKTGKSSIYLIYKNFRKKISGRKKRSDFLLSFFCFFFALSPSALLPFQPRPAKKFSAST